MKKEDWFVNNSKSLNRQGAAIGAHVLLKNK